MSAALAVTDEVALPIRAVGDLAAAAEVSREEVAVITQCAALGTRRCVLFLFPPCLHASISEPSGVILRNGLDSFFFGNQICSSGRLVL
uniref:Uncharacterized protein n=1 Tax=Zea mays TaxID=4577 RepID=B6U2Y2_MAIZE|nr:hypothetical protein [Zea mays]